MFSLSSLSFSLSHSLIQTAGAGFALIFFISNSKNHISYHKCTSPPNILQCSSYSLQKGMHSFKSFFNMTQMQKMQTNTKKNQSHESYYGPAKLIYLCILHRHVIILMYSMFFQFKAIAWFKFNTNYRKKWALDTFIRCLFAHTKKCSQNVHLIECLRSYLCVYEFAVIEHFWVRD